MDSLFKAMGMYNSKKGLFTEGLWVKTAALNKLGFSPLQLCPRKSSYFQKLYFMLSVKVELLLNMVDPETG